VKNLFPFPYVVRIPNVQAEIDESEVARKQQSRADEFFSTFQTSGAITSWVTEQATKHQDKAQHVVIGRSYNGEDIYALLVNRDGTRKPTFVIQCGIHAREWITPSTCCWIIDQLLNFEPPNSKVNSFQWAIVPLMNVDGYDYTFTSNRLWRKNRQPNSGSTCVGTDLNRNYGFGWSGPGASSNPCTETYYGQGAFSSPETQAIRNLVQSNLANDHIVAFFDIHSYGAYWVSPWGYTCSQYPPDWNAMSAMMQAATDAVRPINGRSYTSGDSCNVIYQTSGSSTDYAYGSRGIVHSYTVEAFGSNFTPPPAWIEPMGTEICAGVFQTALEL